MKAYELYKTLSAEPFWATKSRTVRWIAARYYAGVITFGELLAHTKTSPSYKEHLVAPIITAEDAKTIVSLR